MYINPKANYAVEVWKEISNNKDLTPPKDLTEAIHKASSLLEDIQLFLRQRGTAYFNAGLDRAGTDCHSAAKLLGQIGPYLLKANITDLEKRIKDGDKQLGGLLAVAMKVSYQQHA